MSIAAEQGGQVSGRTDLLDGLRDIRLHVERGDLGTAIIEARVLQHDPALAQHPDLASEVLGNLGTMLLLEATAGSPNADRLLGEAIDLLNRARTMRRPAGVALPSAVFDINLVLAHGQRFRVSGRAGDLLLANLILDGVQVHGMDAWLRDVRKFVEREAKRKG